jgi:hypothetical protein
MIGGPVTDDRNMIRAGARSDWPMPDARESGDAAAKQWAHMRSECNANARAARRYGDYRAECARAAPADWL